MKKTFILCCLISFIYCNLLQGCGNIVDDGVSEPIREFTFSKNDIIVNNGKQTLRVEVTNNRELRTWGFKEVVVSVDGSEPITYYSEGIVDGVILDNFSQDCFDLTRKNDGDILEVKLSENETGTVRKFNIAIDNGYDIGKLRITQKTE